MMLEKFIFLCFFAALLCLPLLLACMMFGYTTTLDWVMLALVVFMALAVLGSMYDIIRS